MRGRYYFGIDLGTTNSVIAVYDNATKSNHAITLPGGDTLLKSQIWQNDLKEIKIGAVTSSQYVDRICDVKSSIDTDKIFTSGELSLNSVQASTLILKSLYSEAVKQFGEVESVVITVPAKFNYKQRENTLKAAKFAGIPVRCLVNEPTAAALAYMDDIEKPENIIVYDLGGGTFDVSLVNILPRMENVSIPKYDILLEERSHQIATVLASGGNVNLGGNDIDDCMVAIALEESKVSGISLKDMKKLKLIAQKVKEDDKEPILKLKLETGELVVIKSEHCYLATKIIYNSTKNIVNDLLNSYSNIPVSRIVLVGGSTKNPLITKFLSRDYPGIPIYNNINPDECVAVGAAKNNYIYSEDSGISFYDVVSGTYGTEALDAAGNSKFVRMIGNGSPIPTFKLLELVKNSEGQSRIDINIYQGESLNIKQNTLIGTLTIKDIPEDMDLTEKIRCTFSINKSGMLTVSGTFRNINLTTSIDTNEVVVEDDDDDFYIDMLKDVMGTVETTSEFGGALNC